MKFERPAEVLVLFYNDEINFWTKYFLTLLDELRIIKNLPSFASHNIIRVDYDNMEIPYVNTGQKICI